MDGATKAELASPEVGLVQVAQRAAHGNGTTSIVQTLRQTLAWLIRTATTASSTDGPIHFQGMRRVAGARRPANACQGT